MRVIAVSAFALVACATHGAPRARAVAPEVPSAATPVAPPAARLFGTDAPTIVLDYDPSERWVAICQARADTDHDGVVAVSSGQHGEIFGDAMSPYLVVGGGPGVALDDFLASSHDGRWLTYSRNGRLLLRDAARDVETDLTALGADTTGDDSPLTPPRAVSFSPYGASLAYLRARGAHTLVVVRSLDSGAEREIDPGDGLLWRARFVGGGRWIDALVVAGDRDHDGRVEPPRPRTTLASRRPCRGAPLSYSVFGWTGDTPVHRLLPVEGGAPRSLDTLLAVWGDVAITRVGDALVRVDRDGSRRELVPASCAARISASDEASGRALVVCTGRATRGQTAFLSVDGITPASFSLDPPPADLDERRRFVWRGDIGMLVDLREGRAITLDGEYVRTIGSHALVRQRARYAVLDLARGAYAPLPEELPVEPWPRGFDDVAYLGGWLVDVPRARVLGHVDAPPAGVSTAGRALTFAQPREEFSVGPLAWQAVAPARAPRTP